MSCTPHHLQTFLFLIQNFAHHRSKTPPYHIVMRTFNHTVRITCIFLLMLPKIQYAPPRFVCRLRNCAQTRINGIIKTYLTISTATYLCFLCCPERRVAHSGKSAPVQGKSGTKILQQCKMQKGVWTMITKQQQLDLEKTANSVRQGIITATHAAKSGHPGGSLGAADIFTYLYFKEMNIDPKNPQMEDRDRFVLSKGHTAPGLYSTLAHRGFFPVDDLKTLRHIGSHLQGHPSMRLTPGVDMSTGSLGQGISVACGMALGAKYKNMNNRVYALLGDGELNEGQCWEAFMFAAHYKLDNLCAIIDINGLQIDGCTKDVMCSDPVDEKMKAFGFEVISINGNNMEEIDAAFAKAREVKGKPVAIIARTIKGKGVSYMENKAGWHGKAPNDDETALAQQELQQAYQKLEGEA